jgi:hypothetical protein
MKIKNTSPQLRLVVMLLSLASFAVNASADDPPKKRALSLRVLQQQAANSCTKNGLCPSVISNMAGLTKITGYIVDKKNQDIIVIGEVSSDSRPILLEDFVVAMKNAWLKYSILRGNTRYYSNPGCSIDPDPSVMRRLSAINFGGSSSTHSMREWEAICRMPQNVRVMGIPFDSHFASVIVDADYDMKKIVDGSDSLNITDFMSLMDMRLEVAKKQYLQNVRSFGSQMFMNRFWFFPGDNKYREDSDVVLIEDSSVVLLTEAEYFDNRGGISGRNHPDPLAKEFCGSFSTKYQEIAQERPIYFELMNLFRLVAVAKIMKMKLSHAEAGLNLDYFLEKYQVIWSSKNRHPVKQP